MWVAGHTTNSTGNLATAGASQPLPNGGPTDAFVARISADGTTLLSSMFYGGTDHDRICEVEVDARGCVVVAGVTEDPNQVGTLPGTAGSVFPTCHGGATDAFLRSRVVPPPPEVAIAAPPTRTSPPGAHALPPGTATRKPPALERHRYTWAELLRRVFHIDVFRCECGRQRRLLAAILDPEPIRRVLLHLGLAPPAATLRV